MPNLKYYSQTYFSAQRNADIAEHNKLLGCLDQDLRGKRILDVGCGPGVTLTFVCKDNFVVGVDILHEYCKMAKNIGYSETLCIDVETGLPFPDRYFDYVICTDLFEHIFNTEFLAKEIHRVLSDRGYAILNVPNHNVLPTRIQFLKGKGIRMHKNVEDWNYFHIRFFTWDSWLKFLHKCGFVVVDIYLYATSIPIISLVKYVSFPHFVVKKFPNLLSRRFLVKTRKKVLCKYG